MGLQKNIATFFRMVEATVAAKNSDYAAPETTGNEYHNFDLAAAMRGTTPQEEISGEINKKAVRLANLVKPGAIAKNESRLDTLRDIAGYAAILASLDVDEAAARQPSAQLTLNLEDVNNTTETSTGGRLSALARKFGLNV
jgi:hypothetical protein